MSASQISFSLSPGVFSSAPQVEGYPNTGERLQKLSATTPLFKAKCQKQKNLLDSI